MYITQTQAQQYDRDGFVLVPDMFDAQEVAAMLRDVESGSRVSGIAQGMVGDAGQIAKIAIWSDLGDDIWAAASTDRRIVQSVQILLREEVAFFHGKVMLKEAHGGGAWEWHQDYGYWYMQGFAYPRLISAFVALDPATRANGCLEVIRGSHLLGRLDHRPMGQQTGADPGRMEEMERLLERVPVEMTPGSVLFFHCNLLHTSAPNNSATHRRSFIMCYNARANPHLVDNPIRDEACPINEPGGIMKYA